MLGTAYVCNDHESHIRIRTYHMRQCWDRDQARPDTKSPIDFVQSSRPGSRPRQEKVEIKTGLEPHTGMRHDLRMLTKTKNETQPSYNPINFSQVFIFDIAPIFSPYLMREKSTTLREIQPAVCCANDFFFYSYQYHKFNHIPGNKLSL